MPFLEPSTDIGARTVLGAAPAPADTSGDVFGAAARQSNSVVSAVSDMRNSGPFAPEPGYNVFDDIKDTPYFQSHPFSFPASRSRAETQAIMGRINQENADRATLAGNGKLGTIAGLMMGSIDPVWLMLGGEAGAVMRAGTAAGAIQGAKIAAIGTALQEGGLQATQETRPFEESLLNVGSATLLGGLIGGGAAGLLAREGKMPFVARELDRDRAELAAHVSGGEVVPFEPRPSERVPSPVAEPPSLRGGFTDSRGSGAQFHGAPNEVTLTEGNYGSSTALYGTQGLYTSDALDIVHGYANKKGAKAPSIYEAIPLRDGKPANDIKIYDMEAPITPELRAHIEEIANDPHGGGAGEVAGTALDENPPNLREFFDEARGVASGERIPADEIQEGLFHPLHDYLEAQGFHGMSHRGGLRTKSPEHRVVIYFSPEKNVKLRKMSESELAGLKQPRATPPLDTGPQQSTGVAASAGAAATDTRTLKPVSAMGLEKLPTDPVQRTLARPFIAARRGMADLAEIPTEVEENLTGGTTTLGGGPSLETMGRVITHQTNVAIGDELTKQWTDLRFNGQKAPWFAKLRDWAGVGDKPPELPTFEQFKELVSDAVMNDGKHDIPQVQSAAQFIRGKTFDTWGPRAEAAIEGFKRADQVEGEGYFPHSWDKAKIKANRAGFANNLTELYAGDQRAKAAAQGRLQGYSRDLQEVGDAIKKAKSPERIAALEAEHDALRAKIEGEIAAWQGKTTQEAQAALKAREKYAASREPVEGAARLKSADSVVDKAVKEIIESHRDLSVEDLRSKAHETIDRILGSPDGRLPYDEFAGTPDFGNRPPGAPMRGSLAERPLNVSNVFARDWIERDIEQVARTYMRTFMPDVLLAERFGDVEMENVFRQINDEHAALSDKTSNRKEAEKLDKQKDGAIEDLAAVRDRFRGLYNIPQTASARRLGQISQAVRNANVPLSMGMSAIGSLPDAGGAMFRWGMMSAFRDGWVPFVKSVMSNQQLAKEEIRQFKVMGIAIDTLTAQRHHEFSGISETYKPDSPLERTLAWGADKFQIANMLGPWTDLVKSVSSTVAAAGFLRAAEASVKGTATKKQLRSLGAANINLNMAERIANQYRESGTMIDGVLLPNTEKWTDKEARTTFEGALARDANIMVVTPGLDKPLFFNDPIAAMLFQFKSFTAAAHTRILIANLQRRDADVASGLVGSLGIGMLSYKINSITGGQPTSDNPGDWIKEAMSRGNIFGWFEEGNAMAAKMTRGRADIYRMIGSGKELSRYAGRSALDQLLGPTAGKLERLSQITGAAASRDWSASDSKALRQLTVGQNLFYLRGIFNQIEQGGNNAFGIPMKAQ